VDDLFAEAAGRAGAPVPEEKNMNKIYVLPKDELRGEPYSRIRLLVKKNGWTLQSICATSGLAGGLLSITLGALLWMVVPLLTPGRFGSFLNMVEILFFALSLPLLVLGACCLDLLETSSPILPLPTRPYAVSFKRLITLRPQQPNKN
jgi:hypothetical protein